MKRTLSLISTLAPLGSCDSIESLFSIENWEVRHLNDQRTIKAAATDLLPHPGERAR